MGKRKMTSRDIDLAVSRIMNNWSVKDVLKANPEWDITEQGFRNKMSMMGVFKKRDEVNQAFMDKMTDGINERVKLVRQDGFNLYTDLIQTVRGLTDNMNEELKTGNIEKGKARATAYNAKLLSEAITTIVKGQHLCLGVDEKGVIEAKESEPDVLIIEGLDEEKI